MSGHSSSDVDILRGLAEQYAEITAQPIQDERRELWRNHNSLKKTRPPIFVQNFGMWVSWCRDVFADANMQCEDPFFRLQERELRIRLWMDAIGDDKVLEPWVTVRAVHKETPGGPWGVRQKTIPPEQDGGAARYDHPLKDWADMAALTRPTHEIDEDATAERVSKLQEAIGDILPIDVNRGPMLLSFLGSISEPLGQLRGIEQIMMDMYDAPDKLHELLAFLRDGTLAVHEQAEAAGDFSLTSTQNQEMNYAEELDAPRPNAHSCKRSELWGYCQAQEFTLISPAMHEEFMLRYQLPLMEPFGLMAYGCCGNLTHKIDLLRTIPNLRMIAIAPVADVARCAEQIGPDYVMSWRPNPADMLCCGFDEGKIRRIVSDALAAAKANDCRLHINLKDVETLEGDMDRPAQWTRIVRELVDNY